MRATALALAALCLLAPEPAQAEPKVLASILPLQSLAAGVMAGVGEPGLLVKGAGSPHSYSLRPSEARQINEADVIFWIGPDYEAFLAKPVDALGGKARSVALIKASGVSPLPAREGGNWDEHSHAPGHKHVHKKGTVELDEHVFLDPDNAKAIVGAMVQTLAEIDAVNRSRYEANARSTIERISALDAEIKTALAPVSTVPYVVFHDGYQYFEKRYGLNAVGSITVNPERMPGARRLSDIRRKIDRLKAACVFGEPQFESAFMATVTEGSKAKLGRLDYIGVDQVPGPDAYFGMMRGLARDLVGCLSG